MRKRKDEFIKIRIHAAEKEQLRRWAAQRGVGMSAALRDLIRAAVEAQGDQRAEGVRHDDAK